jgi:hypothetical protein
MAWVVEDTDRWYLDDDTVRHLLLKQGTKYTEIQDVTVHIYEGPEEADLVWPLNEATWLNSHIYPELADVSDEDIWAALAVY